MAIVASPYGQALKSLGLALFNLSSDTLKCMLTTSAYTPDIDTHDFKDDVTNEITGTGYTAGGATLTSVTWTYNSTDNRMELKCAQVVWTTATFTVRKGVFYKDTGTASTSPLLSYVDFGTDVSPSTVDFTLQPDSTGIFRVAVV